MNSLTTGKMRRLQQCATERGVFSILAVDHRQSLRRALSPDDPGGVSDESLVEFKQAVVAALAPAASAVLLDPEYGAEQVVATSALPGVTGLIVALEQTGYAGDPAARVSDVLPGWSAGRAVHVGASGIKLLVYYHPDSPTAHQAESLVRQLAAACDEVAVPFFLEPITYATDPARARLSPQERRHAVVETARRLTAIPGVDVLKAQFPLDVAAEPQESEWLAACRELTDASRVPWILLSAGVDFETYLRQVVVAASAGASGVAVGRAVWREAPGLPPQERDHFLSTVARERMARVTALCQALACPWMAHPSQA